MTPTQLIAHTGVNTQPETGTDVVQQTHTGTVPARRQTTPDGQREASVRPIAGRPPSWDQPAFPPTRIAQLCEALRNAGHDPRPGLREARIDPARIESPDALVTMRQILTFYQAASQLVTDPEFAFHHGAATRVSYLGMYGFAMMSAPDLGRMLHFAIEAQALSANLVEVRVERHDTEVSLRVDPFAHSLIDARMYRFLVEEHFGLCYTALRDLVGADFTPSAIRMRFPQNVSATRIAELIDVPVYFDQPTNAFCFDESLLTSKIQFGNGIVHESVQRSCAALLNDLRAKGGVAHQVAEVLIGSAGRLPTIDQLASRLGMSARELRRKLRLESTGYREICDDVRSQVAMKYLRDTSLAVEHIGLIMGFDNGSNFRRAFHRWTQRTPAEYRLEAT